MRLVLSLLWVLGALHICQAGEPVRIAAAADLRFALDEVLAEFRKTTSGAEAEATYGSSGTLFAQIVNGAPFDLFLAADSKYPRQLAERGFADARTSFVYALGKVVIWVPKKLPLDFKALGLRALLDARVRKLAIANPELAPYGATAVAALKAGGIYDQVKPKLVLGENVAQAAQFAESGAADAGMISLSFALSPTMRAGGSHWELPAELVPPLEQTAVICTHGKNRQGAEKFREFLRSEKAAGILASHGLPPPAKKEER